MKVSNLFGKSAVCMALIAVCSVVNAAQNGRDGAQNSQTGRAGMMSARMPTIPTTGLTTIGNPAVTVIENPVHKLDNRVIPVTPPIVPDTDPDPDPTPDPDCPDGGVINSTYTIDMCMNDLTQCINTGALQGGLNDLFCNEEVRNGVMNGMMLCQSAVDKCIREVRKDCRNIYAQSSDVWLDFNSRVIQPEYYNFVLRKTGLTPHQAENTCLLLDRNTYGPSFSAVSDTNAVNGEYANRVGAYNRANGNSLSKKNPQGVEVNSTGYDGNRGHYARWDACNAECLVRVAAYNKDELIKNNWLFGVMGNDNPAEVWQKAGSTFTCNKDLFDMSLLNDTKTAAVVGVGGGTILGATTGAVIGAASYKSDLCENKDYRNKLENYFKTHVTNASKFASLYLDNKDVTELYDIDADECNQIQNLWGSVAQYEAAIDKCEKSVNNNQQVLTFPIASYVSHTEYTNKMGSIICDITEDCDGDNISQTATKIAEGCGYKSLRKGLDSADIYCGGHPGDCLNVTQIRSEISELKSLLRGIEPLVADSATTRGKEAAKGAAIGGLTGAGVGGIVTGITALVERSNISCRVGDGLDSVALGKSLKIDSLKDFYVKWNLNLPDAIMPTSVVSDLASWQQACSQFNNKLYDCPNVQINLTRGNTYDLIQSACVVSGSICIVNEAVAQSHGIQ